MFPEVELKLPTAQTFESVIAATPSRKLFDTEVVLPFGLVTTNQVPVAADADLADDEARIRPRTKTKL